MNIRVIVSAAALMWLLIFTMICFDLLEPSPFVAAVFSPLVPLFAGVLGLLVYAVRKGLHHKDVEEKTYMYKHKPRTDGRIDLCCPECFSKDYKKNSNHYRCIDCGANWILRK